MEIPSIFRSRKHHDPTSEWQGPKTRRREPATLNSLLGGASVTNKGSDEANQDSIAVLTNTDLHFNALIAADGIGGLRYGGEAAKIAVAAAKQLLSTGKPMGIRDIFARCQLALYKAAKPLVKSEDLSEFGTTLIVAIETMDRLLIGYLGNGSIWHIRGNYNKCRSETRYMPWCAVNLLNPHSIERGGREVLTGFVSPELIHEPTVIELSKDNSMGDILIMTTDGMSSQDQVQIGKDANGDYWSRTEAWLPRLLDNVGHVLSSADLSTAICKFLGDMKQNSGLDDDTTVAMLITGEAVSFLNDTGSKKNAEA